MVWLVNRECLLLLGTWSLLWYIQVLGLPCTHFCIGFFFGITRLIMDCYFCYCSQHWYDDRPDCVLLLIWLVWWHIWLCPVVNMTGMMTFLTVSCCSHEWYDYIPDSIMLFTWFDWWHTWLCPVVHMTGMMTKVTKLKTALDSHFGCLRVT